MSLISIGNVAKETGVSTHTLRYYEKIELLPKVPKNNAGQRVYDEALIEQIRFIKRAQAMQFSLHQIGVLLSLQNDPITDKNKVRVLVKNKLKALEQHLQDLQSLRDSLTSLLTSCEDSAEQDECPILRGLSCEKSV